MFVLGTLERLLRTFGQGTEAFRKTEIQVDIG